MWRFSIRKREDVQQFLIKIMPFLRVKKQNAILALKFFETFPKGRNYFAQGEEVWEAKEKFRLEMSALNGVDISPATTKRMGRPLSIRVSSDSLNS